MEQTLASAERRLGSGRGRKRARLSVEEENELSKSDVSVISVTDWLEKRLTDQSLIPTDIWLNHILNSNSTDSSNRSRAMSVMSLLMIQKRVSMTLWKNSSLGTLWNWDTWVNTRQSLIRLVKTSTLRWPLRRLKTGPNIGWVSLMCIFLITPGERITHNLSLNYFGLFGPKLDD